jgi:hypothetical protein
MVTWQHDCTSASSAATLTSTGRGLSSHRDMTRSPCRVLPGDLYTGEPSLAATCVVLTIDKTKVIRDDLRDFDFDDIFRCNHLDGCISRNRIFTHSLP